MTNRPLTQLATALLILLIVLGVYLFWYAQVGAETRKIGIMEAQIQTQTQASSHIDLIKSQLNDLNTGQEAISQYFVSTNNVVPYLEGLQATGQFFGSNVTIASVSATPGTFYGKLDLSLTISGPFSAVVRTLGAIEYQPYDTTINTLSLDTTPSSGGSTPSASQWTANADFFVGTVNDTASIAPASVPISATSSIPVNTVTSEVSTTTSTVNIPPVTAPSQASPLNPSPPSVTGPSATI